VELKNSRTPATQKVVASGPPGTPPSLKMNLRLLSSAIYGYVELEKSYMQPMIQAFFRLYHSQSTGSGIYSLSHLLAPGADSLFYEFSAVNDITVAQTESQEVNKHLGLPITGTECGQCTC
jgi:hypothetical protein